MGFFEEKKRDRSPISIAAIVGAAVFSIVWFLRSLSMALVMATAAVLLTWGTSTWLKSEPKSALFRASETNYKFQEKQLIPLVAGVLAWGVSKFLVGQFLGAMVGVILGWILYNRLEEKERMRLQMLEEERRKKRVGEVVSGVLGFGAAAGAVALAAWGVSKAFDGGSSGEPWKEGEEDEDKMMKAPGRGYLMPRKDFEGNPSEYFRRLRGK